MSVTLPTNFNPNHAPTAAELQQILDTLAPGAWQTPSYATNWGAGAGTALKFRHEFGTTDRVLLIGQVHVGGTYSSTIFTLPVGYRPLNYQVLPAYRDNSAAFASVVFNSNGTVVHQGPTTTGVDWCFSGIIQTDI